MVRVGAARHAIRISIEDIPDVLLSADRQRLRQALINLLSNAVKYNREGGTIRVEGTVVDDSRFRFSVHDTGFGIAADDLPRLFTAFERLPSAAGIEGTGLGLALTSELLAAMSGHIGADSAPGVGSTFWIELPLSSETSTARSHPHGPDTPDPGPSRTVLYIEDSPENVVLVERVLARRAHTRLISATDGRSGLELAAEHLPDLILLDLGLPDIPGIVVLEQLRARQQTASIPVVVISGDAAVERSNEVMSLGAAGFLRKPFDLSALVALLDMPRSAWHAEIERSNNRFDSV
jgi:CheY-like chemotaxis protein